MTSDVSISREVARSAPALHARPQDEELLAARLVARRKPGQWISAVVVLLAVALVARSLLTNPRYHWDVVGHFFLRPSIIDGLVLTLWLTAAVMVCGYALGIVLAVMRLSSNPVLRTVSFGYIWLVRSVPPLVQLLFWYDLASLYPTLSLGIPGVRTFATVETAHLFTGLLAAFVAFTLDVAAFSAEIIRGGLLAVESGQTEAAKALGLDRRRIFWRIVMPQAMPAIIPASGNMLIGMLKATSLVSMIAVQDLLYSAQLIYNQNYQIIPLLLVATIWYVILTTVLSIGQYYVERHYGRGRPGGRGFRQVVRDNLPLFGRTRARLAGVA
jgi:polar amino acid transport system permease protein